MVTSILKLFKISVIFIVFCTLPLSLYAGVLNTKHNLSVTGPGTIKAASETGICIFCHTPHNSEPAHPLWNHELSSVENYTNYWSPTLKAYASEADAPPIDGFSKLCLSCHDGTVALGSLVGSLRPDIAIGDIPDVVLGGKLNPSATGYLGTDLSGGHPISFIFNEQLVALRQADPALMQLNWPITDSDVRLYPTQGGHGVQCTSCHDPHGGNGGPSAPPLWRKTTHDDVCLVCHDIISPIGH